MERRCSACRGLLKYAGREKLQLGKTGWLLGDLPNLLAGALQVHIYYCPSCGKIEFYATDGDRADGGIFDENEAADRMPQVPCPYCGEKHDLDDSRCPYCGKRLMDAE